MLFSNEPLRCRGEPWEAVLATQGLLRDEFFGASLNNVLKILPVILNCPFIRETLEKKSQIL